MLLRDDEHKGALTIEMLAQLTQQLDPARNAELIATAQQAVAVLGEEKDDQQAVIEPLLDDLDRGGR